MNFHDMVLAPTGLRFMGRRLPCAIGRAGVRTDKREGDHATPTGTHRIMAMLYRPDRMVRPNSWAVPIGPRDLWCDDSASPAYNQLVRAPFTASHERLRRADPLYDMVLITDYNWPRATPGKGSAIFLHIWRKPHHPTEGCIAFSHRDLRWIVQRIVPGTRLIVPPFHLGKNTPAGGKNLFPCLQP